MSASLPAVEIWGQGTGAGLHPVLRLAKAKYLLGESIRFWVGVEVETPGGVIPLQLRKPCSLEITKPDGSLEFRWMGILTEDGWVAGDLPPKARDLIR